MSRMRFLFALLSLITLTLFGCAGEDTNSAGHAPTANPAPSGNPSEAKTPPAEGTQAAPDKEEPIADLTAIELANGAEPTVTDEPAGTADDPEEEPDTDDEERPEPVN